ncbi:MAG: FG-GAP-like repeat-containing protein, partial [Rhodothermales bacterium]
VKARFALAELMEQQGGDGIEVQRLLLEILALQPDNLAVLVEQARVAAAQEDTTTLRETVERLAEKAALWPDEAQEQWTALQAAVTSSDPQEAATGVAFLRNVLLRLPEFRLSLRAVETPAEQVGELMTRFVRLPTPRPSPSPRDDSLTFDVEFLSSEERPWTSLKALTLDTDRAPAVLVADGRNLQFPDGENVVFPGGTSAVSPSPDGIVGLDVNYDYRVDLALAGAGGLRLYVQDTTGAFSDATAAMALPASVTGAAYTDAWAADVDLEGDIDLVLGTEDGPPRILRNNGDGSFAEMHFFDTVTNVRDFAWTDLDADGDPDATLLDAGGTVHVFENLRGGRFIPRAVPSALGTVLALTVADLNSDAFLDLIALQADGTFQRLWDEGMKAWQMEAIARWEEMPDSRVPGGIQLFTPDLDNNGGPDLVVSSPAGGSIWLTDEQGAFLFLNDVPGTHIFTITDLTDDGRLDLVGLSDEGRPVQHINRGTKPYHWRQVRPRAAQALGDQRINSFGIGGEIEIRAGLLFQKQAIQTPVVHFGMGDNLVADVVRIIWPNGDVQAEFDLLSDQVVAAQQRLKGSCPWLFTYNGEEMQFVTDFIWRSPLGLKINAQETAGIMTTEDWVKIRGDQLVSRDGYYDVRITAELWETHFFDHVSLMVVDHPPETEMYLDERFAFPPPALKVYMTAPPRPIAQAWDDNGQDVTDILRARDERYLDTFGRGAYQGITRDHYVEVDLGGEAPESGPLWLIASGWIRPTDSSINVAISQGSQAAPMGLSLEAPDGEGGWEAVRTDLGFPSGKEKTILIDLESVFRPGVQRRLRLRTNLEIFWDAIAWAVALPDAEIQTHRLNPDVADLRYRGFSVVREADRSSPELPDYGALNGTGQVWRDLVGYYTRFGDVRELLTEVDDRYVIMNAGDELAFRFPVPPSPPDGWVRDFVLIGDGWVKDGDLNTTFSTTVLPLPSHDQPAYTTPSGSLEEDPVYQRHPEDWQRFHTRYVTPQRFQRAMRLK